MLPTYEPSSRVFVGRLWLRRFGRHSGSCRRSCRIASRCCRRASEFCQCQLGPYPIVSADPLTGCNFRHVPEALASPETCTHQTRPNNTNSCAIRTIAGPTMSCMSRVVCRTALGCHMNRGRGPVVRDSPQQGTTRIVLYEKREKDQRSSRLCSWGRSRSSPSMSHRGCRISSRTGCTASDLTW